MHIEIEQEEDGRWLAQAVDFPGVMAYGASREEAFAKVEALARDVREADRERLRALLLEGANSGPAIPVDEAYFAALRASLRSPD